VEVRAPTPQEYAAAGRVTADAYLEFAEPGAGDWDEYLIELADVGGRIGRTDVFVAVEEGEILGCVTLELDETLGDDDAFLPPEFSCIRMLGVAGAARGRGVGRALVQRCIDRSREMAKTTVTLRTTRPMRAAQHLYTSMGFERDPSRDIVYESGFTLLAYRLELRGRRR
jgi:ribosomal protein S18 acetylase RimI-like enzyme